MNSESVTMKKALVIPVAAFCLLAAGCGPGGMTRQDTGTILGGVAGGVIGNQFGSGKGKVAATVAGVIVGGIIGSEIGRGLDEEERRRAMEAEYEALEHGQEGAPRRWRSSRQGRYGSVTPGRRYTYREQTCREFEHTIYIDGRPETMRGKACRQPDGTWKQI
jgi:surface antigen